MDSSLYGPLYQPETWVDGLPPSTGDILIALRQRSQYIKEKDLTLEQLRHLLWAVLEDRRYSETHKPPAMTGRGRDQLDAQYRELCKLLLSALRAQASTLEDESARERFYQSERDRWYVEWGSEKVSHHLISSIETLISETLREEVAASRAAVYLPTHTIPWRKSQNDLTSILGILYDEGVYHGIDLPEDAKRPEKVEIKEFVRLILPLFVNAKTGKPFNPNTVAQKVSVHTATRARVESILDQRR